jgi:putative ABC transport system permease protein
MWRATLKGVLAHRWRLLRTAFAVALGVGFVVGTLVFTDTMGRKIDDILATSRGSADVVVRAKSEFEAFSQTASNSAPVPEGLVPLIADVQGVRRATGSVWGFAQMVDKNGDPIAPIGPPTLGGSWDPRDFQLVSGRAPEWPTETTIDDVTATTYGFHVGEPISIIFQGPTQRFTIAGIFRLPDSYMGATIATFAVSTAQRVLNRVGSFDSVAVEGDAGLSESELRDRVAGALPPGYEAITATARVAEVKDSLAQVMGIFRTALLVFAFVALFVGAFIIFNTFSILVAQRTRELGLLRAVGASKGQIVSSLMLEAFVVGLAASLIGLVLGLLMAYGIMGLLSAFGSSSLTGTALRFAPRTVVVAIASGVLVTVVSALTPARRATHVPPVVAIGGTYAGRPGGVRRRVIAGGVVTAVGIAALLAGLFDVVARPLVAVGAGALLVFIGVAMLSALVARPLASFVGAPLPQLFGEAAHLGRENSMRNPKRTASTAAALMIGVGLVGFVTIAAASFKASATGTIGDTVAADFILEPQSLMQVAAGVSPELADRLRDTPGVGTVSEMRLGQFGLHGHVEQLVAIDPATFPAVIRLDAPSRASVGRLTDLGVLVDRDVATEHGWRVGDTVPMQFQRSGTHAMTIDGLLQWDGALGDYLITLPTYERDYQEQMDVQIGILSATGWAPDATRSQIERVLADFPNVNLEDQRQFVEARLKQVDSLLGMITALLFLSIVIALLGIANTLGMSIFERTRELGLLRAVGMTRRQLRSMVRWEALIIGVIGALLGLAIGVFFGWALTRAMRDQGVTVFSLPVGRLALYVLLAALAGVVASLLPARRAARLNILEAIAFE